MGVVVMSTGKLLSEQGGVIYLLFLYVVEHFKGAGGHLILTQPPERGGGSGC